MLYYAMQDSVGLGRHYVTCTREMAEISNPTSCQDGTTMPALGLIVYGVTCWCEKGGQRVFASSVVSQGLPSNMHTSIPTHSDFVFVRALVWRLRSCEGFQRAREEARERETGRERERDRQGERETEREKERVSERERERDRERDKERERE